MKTEELARRIRIHAIEMTHASGASHVASVLSIADIVAVLYGEIMNVFPDDPDNDFRDRLVLSKGHAGAALYAALAETGFFPIDELEQYCKNGGYLSGHISHAGVPGVEWSTGSLGHGAGVACGMAIAAKMDRKQHHIFTIIGDGENQEGSVWEMASLASYMELNNFTVVVDSNKYQALGRCDDIVGPDNLRGKWEAFGFQVHECDGNNHKDLFCTFQIRSNRKPVCIIAHTIKGKGVSFMENNLLWHYRDPQGKWYEKAMAELGDTADA